MSVLVSILMVIVLAVGSVFGFYNGMVSSRENVDSKWSRYWGLIYGEQGVADGSMPTGMADLDIRHKPKPKLKN